MSNIIILSLPRSGSSAITQLIKSSGYTVFTSKNSNLLGGSDFNVNGYFEDKIFTLLNDQLIRLVYGMQYSFLYTPSLNQFQKISLDLDSYTILDSDNLYMPENYSNHLKRYCGSHWDVWGLTRMLPGEKWHKCYETYKIKTSYDIYQMLRSIVNSINENDKLVIKDPRLALVMPLYNLENTKIVYIKRDKLDVLHSMRSHYGPNMFTTNFLPMTNYCSNHFNYKIGYQDFDWYYDTYSNIIEHYIQDKNHFKINFEDLKNMDSLKNLEDYIGSIIEKNIIY